MQMSWIPKIQMQHFQMHLHLNPSLIYIRVTVRVCREVTDRLAEDDLLKVEDLCPRCCHLSARLVLVDVYFSVLSVSMKSRLDGNTQVIITVQLEMSQVCHYSGDSDFHTTGLHKYKTIPIIQQTIGQNCPLHSGQYSKTNKLQALYTHCQCGEWKTDYCKI